MHICIMKLDIKIGKAVRELRKRKKKTQDEVAKDGFITSGRKYLVEIEKGRVSVSIEYLLKIARGLEVSLIELLELVDYEGIKNYRKPESLLSKKITIDINPSITLYYSGDATLVSFPKRIAIVGTKTPTEAGIEECKYFTKWFVESGYVIVSGLAKGIDTIVHQTCIENEGETIAVLPSGINNIYPPENIELAEKIVKSGGLLLSEYPENSSPRQQNYMERNRILSGLCLGVLIIESELKSETLNTARIAIQQNKLLACVEYDYGEDIQRVSGNKQLIQTEKAIAVNRDNIIEFEKELQDRWPSL